MVQPIPSHQFMFAIPSGLTALWSARAIYHTRPVPFIDILPDRQYMYGENMSQEAKDLCDWLNREGIKALQAECVRTGLQQNETRVVEYQHNGYIVMGNPNASHGYLYIIAHAVIETPPNA